MSIQVKCLDQQTINRLVRYKRKMAEQDGYVELAVLAGWCSPEAMTMRKRAQRILDEVAAEDGLIEFIFEHRELL